MLTACDRLGLSPHGMVTIAGAGATPLHLKGLLDRLGVVPDFVHVGAFKGAAEPLTRTAPSREMVETLEAIVGRYHDTLEKGLVDGRRLDDAKASAAIDRALYTGEAAKAAGLLDSVGVWEDFRAEAVGGAEWNTYKSKESVGGLDFTKLQVFLGLMPPKRPSEKHIALVYAVGSVIDGDGDGILGARQEIAGHTLSTTLRQMAADDAIAAIVLRVNSGGGSAIASEQVFQAVAAAKAKKPVVVSMGRVAASGGYYISTGATKIYATPETLTGSIGVVGGKVALGKALKNLGVDTYHVGRGKRSALWSSMSPWTADERADVLAMMEETYKVFVDRVAQSRGKSYDEIHAIAQGRVWTGEDAKARGLVDALGGLEDALADARQLGGVDPKTELEIYPPEPTLKDILHSLGPVALPVGLRGALVEIEGELGPRVARKIEGALRSLLLLREHHVLAIDWTPGLLDG
ncbi:MAG: signal peptide peptidase SppA [Nannocystaceae bacterium]